MRPVPTDFHAYRQLRRRARAASPAFLLVATLLGYQLVIFIGQDGGVNPFAMIPFLGLCALACAAWFVLGPLWRRSLAARPVVQSLDPTPGDIYGIPELDAPARRHTGLAGDDPPPSRW